MFLGVHRLVLHRGSYRSSVYRKGKNNKMISYSGIYSPNNKNNQKSTAARLVYFRNSRNKKSCNYKCWTFSGFSLPNCNSRTSPMIKYSFFKNHHFLRRLLISSEGSFNFYPSIVLLSYPPKTEGY